MADGDLQAELLAQLREEVRAEVRAEMEQLVQVAGDERSIARQQMFQAQEELRLLKEAVVAELRSLLKDRLLEETVVVDVAGKLHLDSPLPAWTVTGLVEVTAHGIRAADRESAEEMFRQGLTIEHSDVEDQAIAWELRPGVRSEEG